MSVIRPVLLLFGVLLLIAFLSRGGDAPVNDEPIHIVGSSTVFPFSTKVVENLSDRTGVRVIVEQTGSGGGHKLFCDGQGRNTPDATNSSRIQKPAEAAACAANGVGDVIEVQVGYDGIILAASRDTENFGLTLDQLYQALAKDLPDEQCEFFPNPYQRWSDISDDLPDTPIEVYGPPPTSGTRDAFVETAMEVGARRFPCLAELEARDLTAFRLRAQTLREDGAWIDAGENDNILVQTLINTPTAIGVFGYSFLDQNRDRIKGIPIDGVQPEFAAIRDGDYPIVRSLFIYLKAAHFERKPELADYAREFLSEEASGDGGYLQDIGLIPLQPDLKAEMVTRLAGLNDE